MGDRVAFTLRLPVSLQKSIKDRANEMDVSINTYMNLCFEKSDRIETVMDNNDAIDGGYIADPWLPEQSNQWRKLLGKMTEEAAELIEALDLSLFVSDNKRDVEAEIADVISCFMMVFDVSTFVHMDENAYNSTVEDIRIKLVGESIGVFGHEGSTHMAIRLLTRLITTASRCNVQGINQPFYSKGYTTQSNLEVLVENMLAVHGQLLLLSSNMQLNDERIDNRLRNKLQSVLPWINHEPTNMVQS